MTTPQISEPSRIYVRNTVQKTYIVVGTFLLIPVVLFVSLAVGAVDVSWSEVARVLSGQDTESRCALILLHSRLPQALMAILAGAGLAISGASMQAVLRNPLCSPFTLGVSGAAAFGAALVVYCGGGSVTAVDSTISGFLWSRGLVSVGAFASSLLAVGLVLALGKLRQVRAETLILIGVALSAFYGAGIMLLQYVADERQLSAMVYWSFGDTARGSWNDVLTLGILTTCIGAWFVGQSWNDNALALGEEAAMGLGVPVRRMRAMTMFWASLLTAVLVSTLGIIGFVGLVVPHLSRLILGADYRFVLIYSLVLGALLLLVSDTAARLIFVPRILPVSIITAFLGGPIFLSMLLRRRES